MPSRKTSSEPDSAPDTTADVSAYTPAYSAGSGTPGGTPARRTLLGDWLGGFAHFGSCPCGRQHMSTHAAVYVRGHVAYCSEGCAS